uniref:Uncharacterized protein n=1 Tax=Anguilla anguilla TaxID=7936 RepID=A0A0E9TG67_ANGAN
MDQSQTSYDQLDTKILAGFCRNFHQGPSTHSLI